MKTFRTLILATAAGLALAGCQTQQQIVDEMQADAVHTAQRRGAFELNCPAAKAEVLSKEMIQSPIMNPRFAPLSEPSTRSACPAAASARPISWCAPKAATAASRRGRATSCAERIPGRRSPGGLTWRSAIARARDSRRLRSSPPSRGRTWTSPIGCLDPSSILR